MNEYYVCYVGKKSEPYLIPMAKIENRRRGENIHGSKEDGKVEHSTKNYELANILRISVFHSVAEDRIKLTTTAAAAGMMVAHTIDLLRLFVI